jgi:hypothetical protein
MRSLSAALLFVLAVGCSAPPVGAPSLAPRPAEAIDPRIPVPEPVLATAADPALQAQLSALVDQAQRGHSAFTADLPATQKAVDSAGEAQSESWIEAQQLLSALVSLRAPVTRAAADIDSLGAERIRKLGGIAAADMKALESASGTVRQIDESEAAAIGRLQARLSG